MIKKVIKTVLEAGTFKVFTTELTETDLKYPPEYYWIDKHSLGPHGPFDGMYDTIKNFNEICAAFNDKSPSNVNN